MSAFLFRSRSMWAHFAIFWRMVIWLCIVNIVCEGITYGGEYCKVISKFLLFIFVPLLIWGVGGFCGILKSAS